MILSAFAEYHGRPPSLRATEGYGESVDECDLADTPRSFSVVGNASADFARRSI